jgi:glycosyltransferase involved in cell wall biosynthesis
LRVLHVDTSVGWRGGQTQLLHLLRARPQDVVAMRPDAEWRGEVRDARWIPFRAWRGGRALARVIREVKPDLVAAHTSHAHLHAWMAGARPLVVHRRSDFAPGPLSGPKYRAPDGYVAVSAAVREVLVGAGVARERIAVVYDGVDPFDVARPAPGRVVGAVGALVDHKGHDVLIEATGRIGFDVAIAGEGPNRPKLEALARARGVRLRLGRADVREFLGTIDVFAHPSSEEGLGQAVIEAMAAGVPVVASSAGGLPEIVAPGTGRLVPKGDPGALARAIEATLAAPLDGRAHARTFTVARMVAATEAVGARVAQGQVPTSDSMASDVHSGGAVRGLQRDGVPPGMPTQ